MHEPTATDVTPNRRGTRSREAVLDAAEATMAEHGYAGASLARIVERAGVPASSIYHYFGSKDGVLLAVMERGAERFFSAIPELSVAVGPPEVHLAVMNQALQRALEANPDFLRLLIVMATQPPTDSADEALAVVTRVRSEALRRLRGQYTLVFGGDGRSREVDRLARWTLALIEGAFEATQADDTVDLGQLLAHLPAVIAHLHQGAAAPADAGRRAA